jgi:hypothetical protein
LIKNIYMYTYIYLYVYIHIFDLGEFVNWHLRCVAPIIWILHGFSFQLYWIVVW